LPYASFYARYGMECEENEDGMIFFEKVRLFFYIYYRHVTDGEEKE
jgi:hypothetical protein